MGKDQTSYSYRRKVKCIRSIRGAILPPPVTYIPAFIPRGSAKPPDRKTIPLHLLMRRDSYFIEGAESILDTWKEVCYDWIKP